MALLPTYKRKSHGSLFCILKPIVGRWDDAGFMMSGHAVNNIYNYVKVCVYEGVDKFD
jgi:hypothetical protein